MALVRNVERCTVLVAMLIASTASIPVDGDRGFNVVQTFESREDMMIRYRLPNDTMPRLYKITIEPNMDDDDFTWVGETSIDIEILRATRILTLHAYKNLVVDDNSTVLVSANGTRLRPIALSRDDEVEFLKVEFDHEIPVGNYSINFKYVGTDVGHVVGFYKASFASPEMPRVAGTHFEATTARRAFPCWDEPSFKARFRMSIKHFKNYTAVSNMPEIERVETVDGKVLTTFDTTPIMPTYLLTFVIADYEKVSNEYGNVTLWCGKHLLESVKHVLEISPKVVDVMENYTGFSFGLPRIGSVLLPLYSSAATEHWGLVTYSESVITFDRTTDGHLREATVNALIAHELAHSWFGNRVSPVWWDDLWLNEAFAAYFQYYIMDEIFDNWGGAELFVLNNNHGIAFHEDTERAIPVRWTPITNREIRRLFGTMTYRKGAALVHMFRNVLTDGVFRAGIQKFLARHSFSAADANDLMRAFQEAHDEGVNAERHLSVKETMSSWLVQSGYPVVNVTRNYTSGVTKVAQESTLTDNEESTLNSKKKWWVPLTYATQSDLNFSSTAPTSWISDKEDSVTINGIDKDDWVIFNVRWSGYYRVNYDEENWNRITDYLNTDNYKNIHVMNRAQLISDASYMVDREPERYYGNFYKLTKYLSREVEYLPWRAAKSNIIRLDDSLSGTEVHEVFQRYVLGLMNGLIEKVGFEERDNDDHLTILSRTELVGWACESGHSGCSEFAAEKLFNIVENRTEHGLHPDTHSSIFCAGLRGLNDTKAKQVAKWALENEKYLLVRNLGCTENHDIHRDFLLGALTTNSSNAAPDMSSAFNFITMGSEGNFNFIVDFLLQNFSEITHRFPGPFMNPIRTMVHEVKTAARLEKFKKILQLNAVVGGSEIDERFFLEKAQRVVAKSDEVVAKFRNFWDHQLSADNGINYVQPESR